ncbi:MAG: hypothetical protein V2B20_08570 [Pseudomonadota bacterium]
MDVIIRKCIDYVSENIEIVCQNATPGASGCLDCFQNQFFNDNIISYDCDLKINIYVGRYFPVHVRENIEALKLLPPEYIDKLLNLNTINVMNIGGGPGSDSFAVKKYFHGLERSGLIKDKKDIYILRVDRETNWNNMAGFVNERIKNTDVINNG